MNVKEDYQDILQNIEASIVFFYRENPALRDPEVIQACDRLILQYTREKKRLPELPFTLPEKSMALFKAMKAVCETRLTRESVNEIPDPETGYRIPLRILLVCLDRVRDSMLRWHKENGQRGYLEFISQFIK